MQTVSLTSEQLGRLVLFGCAALFLYVCSTVAVPRDTKSISTENVSPELQAPMSRAEGLVAEDKAEQALEVLKDVVDGSPEALRPRLLLGSALMQATKTDEAARVLSEVTNRWPQNTAGHLLLAYVRLDQGEKLRAREGFEKVLEIAINTEQRVAAHLGMASLSENEGQLTEADIHYRKALELEPGLRGFLMTVQKQLLWRQPIAAPIDGSGHAVSSRVRIDGMKDELKKLRDGQKGRGGLGDE